MTTAANEVEVGTIRARALDAYNAQREAASARRTLEEQTFLAQYGPGLVDAVRRLGVDVTQAPEVLPSEDHARLWGATDTDNPTVGIYLDDGLVLCLAPDSPLPITGGLYAAVACPQCENLQRGGWIKDLSDLGAAIEKQAGRCVDCLGLKPAPQLDRRAQVAWPDDENTEHRLLVTIAENLAVIAHNLDYCVDCGASVAGRGT
jgi:hypothetical protein